MADTDELELIKASGNGGAAAGDDGETVAIEPVDGETATIDPANGETAAMPPVSESRAGGASLALPNLESIRSHAGLLALGGLALLVVLLLVIAGGPSSQGSQEELNLPNVESSAVDEDREQTDDPAAVEEEAEPKEKSPSDDGDEGPSGGSDQPPAESQPEPPAAPPAPEPAPAPAPEPPAVTPPSGGVNP